ncbi:hypothetical protein GGI20_003156 [Coemansia sp. BCRC 34301]|nr:hypothetical protein GGI20_003156 [Coemansia sp. BCRC 34301]
MESNNLYVFHRGDAIASPKKNFLFVFPYSKDLSSQTISKFVISAFNEKRQRLRNGAPNYSCWMEYSACQRLAQLKSAKTIMIAKSYFGTTYLNIQLLTAINAQAIPRHKVSSMASKMDELVKFYEDVTAVAPASKMGKVLAGKNIYYCDARKADAYEFDKRSDEGKAFIQAKLASKREKQMTQRARNAGDRRRNRSIDIARQCLHDN